MENSLKKNVSQMAEEYTGTEVKKAFKDGAAALAPAHSIPFASRAASTM